MGKERVSERGKNAVSYITLYLLTGLIAAFLMAEVVMGSSGVAISAPKPNENVLTYSTWLNFTAETNDACQYVLCKSTEVLPTLTVTGDSWVVQQGAKKLEFSERLDAGTQSSQQENIRNITTFIGKDELPTLLADGVFSNTHGDYDYRQYIYFDSNPPAASAGNPIMLSVVYAEDPDTDKAADYLFIDGQNGNVIARYALDFVEKAMTDVTDSAGAVSPTGTYLWNFEGVTIKMLGKDWVITKARTDSTNHSEVDMALMSGAVKDTLNEGESETYTINGKDYAVTLDFVGSTTTRLTINGEVTDSLSEGDIQTLRDGTNIAIKDIISQEFGGGIRKVEFYLGADRIRLRDTDTIDKDASGEQTLEFGTETITGTKVRITGGNSSNSYNLSSIDINITADQDYYVPAGGKLSQELRKPQALLNSWNIEYAGLKPARTEKIWIKPAGNNQHNLEFADGSGNTASVPVAYTTGGSNFKIGDDQSYLILSENQTMNIGNYFIVSDIGQKQGERLTYAFKYINASKNASTDRVMKFLDTGSGATIDIALSTPFTEDINGAATAPAVIRLGSSIFRVWAASNPENDNFSIRADLDGDGSLDAGLGSGLLQPDGEQIINITTKNGAQILLIGNPANSTANSSIPSTGLKISIQTVDADDYDSILPAPVTFALSASNGKLNLIEDTTAYGNLKYINSANETNTSHAYTSLGAKVKWEKKPNEAGTVEVDYPKSQRTPYVIIATPTTKVIWNNGTTTESCESAKDVKLTGTGKRSELITGYENTIDSETIAEKNILKITCNDAIGSTSQNSVQFFVNVTDTDNDGFSDVEDNCKDYANPDQRDTDGDGAGNWCDLDDDGDGINDTDDTVLGDATKINTSTITPYIEINKSANLTKIFNDAQEVSIKDQNTTLVEFVYNFSAGMLDLRDITVDRVNSTKGAVIINIKSQAVVGTKTLYVDNVNNLTTLCLKDSEVYSLTRISSLCNSENESGISCPGTANNGKYNCTFTDETNRTFKIIGLEHSAAQQQSYCGDGTVNEGESCSSCPADAGACPPTSTPSSGGGSGGGGGGGTVAQKVNKTANLASGIQTKPVEKNVSETQAITEETKKNDNATAESNVIPTAGKTEKKGLGQITGLITGIPQKLGKPAGAALILTLTFTAGIYLGRMHKRKSNTVKFLIRPKQIK